MRHLKRLAIYFSWITFAFVFPSDANAETAISNAQLSLELYKVLSDLDSPESVIPNSQAEFLYVSNVNGEGDERNSAGYIARVSLNGELIEKHWVAGLNAPKGLALLGATLFVSDIDQLVSIDTTKGVIKARVDFPGAKFLNDVVKLGDHLLVSDSGNARIYKYEEGNVSIWLEDERLGGINGLLVEDGKLLITTMDAGALLSLDLETMTLSLIADGMTNADGLSVLDDGSYLVSSWPGRLYHVKESGEVNVLLDTQATPVFLNDFYILENTLIIPNWQPGSLQFYRIVKGN